MVVHGHAQDRGEGALSGHSVQRGSVSVLETVAEFATDSDFAQTPNYVDSGAPPIKFALLLGLGIIIIRCSRMANDTRWHPKSLTMMPGDVDPTGSTANPTGPRRVAQRG
jgi:hypothetical protein